MDVDGYYDMGPGPTIAQKAQESNYPLSQCMSCGCCLEACPQFTKVEILPHSGETEDQLQQRQEELQSELQKRADEARQKLIDAQQANQ